MITRAARSRGPSAPTASAAMFASARSAVGSSSSRRSAWRTSTSTRSSAAFRSVASTASGSKSKAGTGREAELRRGDREHAGAAADVEHAAALLALEQLQAELRRRVAAGAERAARIDDDRDRVRRPGASQGGPIQSGPTRTGLWNWRQRSSQSGLDLGRRGAAERLPDPLLAGRVRVGRELEPAVARRAPRTPPGRARACRARLLGPRVEDGDRDAAQQRQRNALLSFSKKPSSRRYVSSPESARTARAGRAARRSAGAARRR